MVRRVLSSLFIASVFAFGLGSVTTRAAAGVVCNVGGSTFNILVGDVNPDPNDWRDYIESTRHATDICMNFYGGRTNGRVK
jgi:hypothetical protein